MSESKENSTFEIELPQFKGPFDLMLFFIERDELDIYDIPIHNITTDFLDYIQKMKDFNMEVASEFIVVAATLMKIKAKMLLPRKQLDEDGNTLFVNNLDSKLIIYNKPSGPQNNWQAFISRLALAS